MFGEAVDIASSIGQGLLTDLDLSYLEHTTNYYNIVFSWFFLGIVPCNGTIVYGLMDRGQNWQDTFTSDRPIEQSQMTPYLKVKWLLDKILSTAGYTYDSVFLNSIDFGYMFLPMANGSETTIPEEIKDQTMAVGLYNYTTTTSTTPIVLLYLETAIYGYDAGSNYDPLTGKWTAPYGALVNWEVSGSYENCVVQVRHLASGATGLGTVVDERVVPASGEIVSLSGQEYYLPIGDRLFVTFYAYGGGTAQTWGNNYAVGGGSYFHITSSIGLANLDFDPVANMPKSKQIDFVMSLQTMFNLVFIPNKNDPKKLTIEPFKDFMDTGESKDWTSKIDFTKDMVIKPTTDLQTAKYLFTHSPGQDFVNKAIENQLGRVYGSKEILDTNNDYARNETTIKSTFAPHVMTNIPNNGMAIHRMIDGSGASVKDPKIRLAYWTGTSVVSVANGWRLRDDASGLQLVVSYPMLSNYSDQVPTPDSSSLNFGWEIPMIFHEAHPYQTLYNKYYLGYVNELYSSEARTLDCFMLLTDQDIYDMQWNDKIYIENSYYRILSISGYDATTKTPCSVKLIKILQDVIDCEFTPTGYTLAENIITFNNSATEYGNKHCCERYGYVWTISKATPADNRCRPLGITSTPTIE